MGGTYPRASASCLIVADEHPTPPADAEPVDPTYGRGMTEQQNNPTAEAVQAVVDRVTSWQDGATTETILTELTDGAHEVGVELGDDDLRTLAEAIESEHGTVDAAKVLGL
jgi:hypothetical protein